MEHRVWGTLAATTSGRMEDKEDPGGEFRDPLFLNTLPSISAKNPVKPPPGAAPGRSGPLGQLWELLEELWEALGELWEALGELWDVSERVKIPKTLCLCREYTFSS